MHRAALALAASGLVGCSQPSPPVNAISVPVISKVLGEIKREVSVYQSWANNWRMDPGHDPADVLNLHFVCGKGKVDFNIVSVAAELTATSEQSIGGSLGVTVPVVGPTGSIGPSAGTSRDVNNTQTMNFTLYPIDNPSFRMSNQDGKPAPIAEALRDLRTALIKGATSDGLCMYDYNHADPKSDKGHSYVLGLTVTDDTKGGVDIKLAIVSFSFNGETKSVTGNTLTVTFQQRDILSGNDSTGKLAPTSQRDDATGVVAPTLRRHSR